ncbi:hypothetical protein [Magnetofaba australis]|uniref:Uncharacterized protein n=1 Tax=Magnetofaba australis IT-1 TaxID=1434232 RepID=A0A1Y2K249_9PROT|nr:hypothetical protein [Magnetofaba australis]OSM02121.1 hypothetical protein MAIT1_02213 [Magnetofaba australis IT-1]
MKLKNFVYLKELEAERKAFEDEHGSAMAVRLTPEMAKGLRWELHCYFGVDPGPDLYTLFGMEVLTKEADALSFEP